MAWHSLTKRGPKQPTSSERSVSSKREQMDSVVDHQRALPHGRAGSRLCGLRIGLTDVGKPAGAHGRTKIIAQLINCFGNSSFFVLPHVIRKSKLLTYLAKMSISVIIVISIIMCLNVISVIMEKICYNNHKVYNVHNCYNSINVFNCYNVL